MLVPYRRKFVRRYHDWMKDPFLQGMCTWDACNPRLIFRCMRIPASPLHGMDRDDGVGAVEPSGGVRDAGLLEGRPKKYVCVDLKYGRSCVRPPARAQASSPHLPRALSLSLCLHPHWHTPTDRHR